MTDSLSRTYLSEEDLDLRSMTVAERFECYTFWLILAQRTNSRDAALYSHGVFSEEPGAGKNQGADRSGKPPGTEPCA